MMKHQIAVNNVRKEDIVFTKILGMTDKEHQLLVPTRVLDKFPVWPAHQRDFTAFDRAGKAWPFVLAIRKTERYDKPVLQKAQWHEFVRVHNLVGGREGEHGVVFFKPQNYPLQVRALEKVLIFGAEVGWTALL